MVSSDQVRRAAKDADVVLRREGLQCCIVGGLGCALYGMKGRTPGVSPQQF